MDLGPLLRLQSEIVQLNSGKVMILGFSGKITSDNIFELNNRVKEVFGNGVYNVILDLGSLEYINSTGIALLLSIAKTIEQNAGKLILVNPTAFIRELLEMTDLSTRFDVVDSIEEARNKISA